MTEAFDSRADSKPTDWHEISGLIFGLRIKPADSQYLEKIWRYINSHDKLRVLKSVVGSFSEILANLSEERTDVRSLTEAVNDTKQLQDWMSTGSASHILEATSGIVILPLLSLIQVTQYFNLLHVYDLRHRTFIQHLKKFGGIQGYCGGLPTAIAVAGSADDDDIVPNVAMVLRLAFVIGVFGEIGDNRAVSGPTMIVLRLKYRGQGEEIVAKFPGTHVSAVTDPKSITISGSADVLSHLYNYAKGLGLLVQDWPLRGRWHHPENSQLAEELSHWCKSNLQFPSLDTGTIFSLLRSNRTGELVSASRLEDELIHSVLASKCEWHSVLTNMSRSLKLSGRSSHVLVSFGIGDCTPLFAFHENSLRITKIDGHKLFNQVAAAEKSSDTQPITSSNDPMTSQVTEDGLVAIVGSACRLPGASNLEDLWRLLSQGQDMHRPLDSSRFDLSNGYRASQSSNFVSSRRFYANFLDDVKSFDHAFFGISPREAVNMDPQQRILLEVAYEAMDASGYMKSHRREDHDPIACFVGASAVDYHENTSAYPPTAYTSTGTIRSFLSGKISHYFGWTGPSEVIDTACSSSLVAINRAVRAIQGGECTMALAGGINIITSPQYFMDLGKAGFLSPTGQCKPFDEQADGYCRSDGAGLVVLKPLNHARRDADQILGVINGVATNQSGATASITVPSRSTQSSLYRQILAQSGVTPQDVSYVEAHGTGTSVGDPIEIESIREVFGDSKRRNPLHIGSIKGNLGHCETAAGVAGLLKILTMINRGRIPPQTNHRVLNRNIPSLEDSGLSIPQQEHIWKDTRRSAMVNSYGAAGSNSALLVSGDTFDGVPPETTDRPVLTALLLTANTESSLRANADALASYLDAADPKPAFVDVVHTLCRRRQRHKLGAIFHASDTSSLTHALRRRDYTFQSLAVSQKPLILVLSGQNKKGIRLSRELYSSNTRLQYHLHRLETTIAELGFPSILSAIFAPGTIEDAVVLQMGMAAVQLAFAKCWLEAGIAPDAVVGHSLGELVALGVSGVLSERDCLALIGHRASLIKTRWGEDPGLMLVVKANRKDTEMFVDSFNRQTPGTTRLEIACFNGPSSHVIVGGTNDIREAQRYIGSTDFLDKNSCHVLEATHAFHSHLVEPILTDLDKFCETLSWQTPTIPLEVCREFQPTSFNAYKVSTHARKPVYFVDAIYRLEHRLGSCLFLECGMNTAAIPMVERATQNSRSHNYYAITGQKAQPSSLLTDVIIKMWQDGVDVEDWPLLNVPCRQIWLPPYQFDKPEHWLPNVDHAAELRTQLLVTQSAVSAPKAVEVAPRLLAPVTMPAHDKHSALFSINTTCDRFSTLTTGHKVRSRPMAPAALYLECAAMGLEMLESDILANHLHFCHISYHAPIASPWKGEVLLELQRLHPNVWSFSIATSKGNGDNSAHTKHATGQMELTPEWSCSVFERLMCGEMEGFQRTVQSESLTSWRAYRLFDHIVEYEPIFQGIDSIKLGAKEAFALATLPQEQPSMDSTSVRSMCDTVVLDIFIQVVGLLINTSESTGKHDVMVGTGFEKISISRKCNLAGENTFEVFARYEAANSSEVIGDILVRTINQEVVVTIVGCRFSKVAIPRLENLLDSFKSSDTHGFSATTPDSVSSGPTQSTPATTVSKTTSEIVSNSKSEKNTQLRRLISSYTGVAESSVTEGMTLEELGVDSLAARELASEMELSFGASLDPMKLQAESLRSLMDRDDVTVHVPNSVNKPSNEQAILTSILEQQAISNSNRGLDLLLRILGDYSGAPKESIIPEARLSDLGIDSLASLELRQELESTFSIALDDRSLDPDSTVSDVMKSLQIRNETSLQDSLSTPTPTQDSSARLDDPTKASSALYKAELDLSTLSHPVDELARNDASFESAARKCGFANYWSLVADDQNELLLAYICEAFAHQDLDLSKLTQGEEFPMSSIRYLAKHERVMKRYFEILEAHEILVKRSGVYSRGPKSMPSRSATELHAAFIKNHPDYTCEAQSMALIGPKLAQCLQGKVDAMDCLFGKPEAWGVLESFYHDAPLLSTATELLVNFVMQYINRTGREYQRPLEILEVGAGTGGTTKRLVKALAANGIPVRYTFTDISRSLLRRAQKTFAQHDWIQYEVYDLELRPDAKLRERFDIVLGTNTIHATSDRVSVLAKLRETMNEHGFIVISETTQILDWCDLVFGLLDGWWLAEGGTAYPLQSANVWMDYFESAGYGISSHSRGTSRESNTQQLLLACKTNAFGAPTVQHPLAPPQPSDLEDRWRLSTMTYKQIEGVQIDADVYFPRANPATPLSVGLLIHGGGCFTLSKRSVRPKQISFLLSQGILPISLNYRLCPQTSVIDGAMNDIRDACAWIESQLPTSAKSLGFDVDSRNYIVIGYSTGGHLALSTAWILKDTHIKPPRAIVSFYAPTIFKKGALKVPHNHGLPRRRTAWDKILSSLSSKPVVSHEPQGATEAPDLAWLRAQDPRSEMILSIFTEQTGLALLLNNIPCGSEFDSTNLGIEDILVDPPQERIEMICPLAQLEQGHYHIPTCLVHGTADEIAPFEDAAHFHEALRGKGVECEMLRLEGAKHLFDVYARPGDDVWRNQVLPALQFAANKARAS